jgi:hypothetical protein
MKTRQCPVVHPTFGRCIETGTHGDAKRPHRYAAGLPPFMGKGNA